jgi:hypothetical protein
LTVEGILPDKLNCKPGASLKARRLLTQHIDFKDCFYNPPTRQANSTGKKRRPRAIFAGRSGKEAPAGVV